MDRGYLSSNSKQTRLGTSKRKDGYAPSLIENYHVVKADPNKKEEEAGYPEQSKEAGREKTNRMLVDLSVF